MRGRQERRDRGSSRRHRGERDAARPSCPRSSTPTRISGWEKYTSWGAQNFTRREPDRSPVPPRLLRCRHGDLDRVGPGVDRPAASRSIRSSGRVGGARYVPEPGLGTPGGGANPNFTNDPGWWGAGDGFYEPATPEDARNAVRAEAAKGIQVFKIWVDARDLQRGGRIKLSEDIYRAAIDEAIVHDIKVLAHAPDVQGSQAPAARRRPPHHSRAERDRRRVDRLDEGTERLPDSDDAVVGPGSASTTRIRSSASTSRRR